MSWINLIKSCPSLSLGCALPANIIWTGIFLSLNIWVILSKSLNINVALLYVANLLANPIVSMLGSSFPTICSISSYE